MGIILTIECYFHISRHTNVGGSLPVWRWVVLGHTLPSPLASHSGAPSSGLTWTELRMRQGTRPLTHSSILRQWRWVDCKGWEEGWCRWVIRVGSAYNIHYRMWVIGRDQWHKLSCVSCKVHLLIQVYMLVPTVFQQWAVWGKAIWQVLEEIRSGFPQDFYFPGPSQLGSECYLQCGTFCHYGPGHKGDNCWYCSLIIFKLFSLILFLN